MPADDSAQRAFKKWDEDRDGGRWMLTSWEIWLEAWHQGRQEGFEAGYSLGRRETAEEDADGD